jgi:hypothetical protein
VLFLVFFGGCGGWNLRVKKGFAEKSGVFGGKRGDCVLISK